MSTQPAKIFHNQIEQSSSKNSSKNFKIDCIICKGSHHFLQCSSYKAKSIEQRIEFVK